MDGPYRGHCWTFSQPEHKNVPEWPLEGAARDVLRAGGLRDVLVGKGRDMDVALEVPQPYTPGEPGPAPDTPTTPPPSPDPQEPVPGVPSPDTPAEPEPQRPDVPSPGPGQPETPDEPGHPEPEIPPDPTP